MFEFTQYTVEVPGEPPAVGYADDWTIAIYQALSEAQRKSVRDAVRERAEKRAAPSTTTSSKERK